ncbi:MAG: hypothetical protein ATN32_00380 [Candidatus Epulonipiscium fishelsonii]|nr:MAG: hypothetical protein ATN32_00380 [Epulopiscium sp. AS2M-Bin002]
MHVNMLFCFIPLCLLLQVQAASVLFVDNPVGTGFSYTDRPDGFATNVATVASDMLVLLQHFFTARPEFQVCKLDADNSPVCLTEA